MLRVDTTDICSFVSRCSLSAPLCEACPQQEIALGATERYATDVVLTNSGRRDSWKQDIYGMLYLLLVASRSHGLRVLIR